MKKLAFCLAIVLSICCIFSSIYADTAVTLTSTTVSNGVVTIKGTITEPSTYQRYTATVLKYKETNDGYTVADAIYIGQKESTDVTLNNGKFTFTFNGNLSENEKYLVRIGGTNVESPVSADVVFGEAPVDPDSTPDPSKPLLGDVDGNGTINVEDASILMQFVLDKNGVPRELTESEEFFVRSNVTGDKELTAVQVGYILQKALDKGFLFPNEKK